MPIQDANGLKLWQRRTKPESLVHWVLWLNGVAIFAYCWQQISKSTTWFFVWDAPRIANDIWTRATPPKWEYITQLGKLIWDTLNIATLGTIFALLLAIPVAFLAARNATPSRFFIRPIALLIIVSTRSISSLIWALLLIAIIGPGVFAGVIAVSIRSIGFCAKLLYEAIEEIDTTQVEAITATGASLGHQYSRKYRVGTGRCGRDRVAIFVVAQCLGMAASVVDFARDLGCCYHFGMGLGQSAWRDYLSRFSF